MLIKNFFATFFLKRLWIAALPLVVYHDRLSKDVITNFIFYANIICMEKTLPAKTRKKYEIKYHEWNLNKALKESMFMLFLQDIATQNADDNGFGYYVLSQKNLGWFLLKYRIEFSQYPTNTDYIEIETQSRGVMRIFATREFTIYNSNNEIIGRVMSMWALVNLADKSMISPASINNYIGTYEKKDDDLSFGKIRIPDKFDWEKEFEVRFDDIDINNHANNTNYISWGLDALPHQYRMQHSIKNIDMVFKKDAALGETLLSKVFIDKENNKTIHVILNKDTNEDLCNIAVEWV